MLKLLRKKGVAKKIIWFIAIVIIISFGFFGTAYLLTGQGTARYAGKIYGKKIPIEDFNKVYQNTRIQAIRQYGNNLNKVAHLLNLDAQTWDRLILLHEADKRKIRISNDEIVASIQEDPSFRSKEQFDILLYNRILRSLNIRPRDYEENVRDNLKIVKLYKEVASQVTISEDEVIEEFKNLNEKVQVSYIFVANDTFKNEILPTEPEIEQYYQDHREEFLLPPSINVSYITLNFPEEPTTAVNNDSSETDPALEPQNEKIREQANHLFEKLLINPDMEQLAKDHALIVKTTGFFSMEQPNLTLGWSYDLLDKIFQMEVNEIHEPFETSSGLIIMQIKEKRNAYIPEFKEAAAKAREKVVAEKAKSVARNKAGEYLEVLKAELDKSQVKDFPKSAKSLGLEIYQTPVFNRGQYLPQIGISKEFQETAFGLSLDKPLSGVVEVDKGFCLLHLDNYIPADEDQFDLSREELAQKISNEKQSAAFGNYIMQLRVKADLTDNIPRLRDIAE